MTLRSRRGCTTSTWSTRISLGGRRSRIRVAFTQPEEFGSLAELKAYACDSLDGFDRFLEGESEARLAETITIPWFTNPPLSITVTQALTQCAMHSRYHRGQNATRLRELGGDPPLTDLIAWCWRPARAGMGLPV